jgi:hypothetical protein
MEEVKQLGRVYKITSPNTDKIYIGSTTNSLKIRLRHHMSDYKKYSNGNGTNYITSFEILKCDNIQIELIEEFLGTRKELHKRERHFIESNKSIVINKAIPTRTDAEYRLDNKEIIAKANREYRNNNKEIAREYNIKNKEHIALGKKQYMEKNKDYFKQKKKEYREINKEKLHEKINCECGGKYTRTHKARHQKSIQHINHFTINITVPIDNHDGGIININQK